MSEENFSYILTLIQNKLPTLTNLGSSTLIKKFLESLIISLESPKTLQEKLDFLVNSKLSLNDCIRTRFQHQELISNMKDVDILCLFVLDNILSADETLHVNINIRY